MPPPLGGIAIHTDYAEKNSAIWLLTQLPTQLRASELPR